MIREFLGETDIGTESMDINDGITLDNKLLNYVDQSDIACELNSNLSVTTTIAMWQNIFWKYKTIGKQNIP
jgi:hypothetical protein